MGGLEFVGDVWLYQNAESPEIEHNLAAFGPDVPVCVLKSRTEVSRLLARIPTRH